MFQLEWLFSHQHKFNPWLFYGCVAPFTTILSVLTIAVGAIVLKWVTYGSLKEGLHPWWSCWCYRWRFVYDCLVSWLTILDPLKGTLLHNFWLRLMGLKIGKRVFIGPDINIVDPDLLNFEDDTTVMCGFQAHTFEDRVLKNAPLYVRRGATVGSDVTLMYGADVKEGAWVGEHSVVIKREVVPARKYYIGFPIREGIPPQSTEDVGDYQKDDTEPYSLKLRRPKKFRSVNFRSPFDYANF